ncbi:DUF2553 family protein [Bacillus horti]|uniref:DUF2553 family protein n=1 Tax=Caldalkalibacillus horti TaxID=77523 RepID=A0ABT9VU23_9BACI|nr:DUF2553 family protein [Bacillus horti]MDQ0164481.1 hypothetical protein [Bacillus horti]
MTQQSVQNEPRVKKVEISNKVIGKIQEDKIVFYVGERYIGSMSMSATAEKDKYKFEEGFGIEDNKIYQKQVDGVEDDQYVEGCDMGWC